MGKGIGAGCYSICAVVVVIISIILFLIGLALAAVGGVLMWGKSLLDQFVTPMLKGMMSGGSSSSAPDIDELIQELLGFLTPMSVGLLVAGIFLIVLGFCGMFGPCCKSKCLLFMFLIVAGAIFIAEMAVLIILMTQKDEYVAKFGDYLTKELQKDYTGINSGNFISFMMNILQVMLECCGVNGGKDYKTAAKWNSTIVLKINGQEVIAELEYPIACCKMKDMKPIDNNCSFTPTPQNNNYQTGCLSKLNSMIDQYFPFIGGGLGGLFGLQAIIVICGVLLLFHAIASTNKVHDAAKY